MHTVWARANAIFAFMLSVLSALTFCVFLSTVWLPNSAPVTLSANNVRVKNFVDYASEGSRSDVVMAELNIKVDVAPIFNWNVKEIFLFLVAEYSTPKAAVNQIVLWDKILRRGEWSMIHEESITPKYYFMDDGTNLLNHKNVTLVMRWNVVPNAGYLAMAQDIQILNHFIIGTSVSIMKWLTSVSIMKWLKNKLSGNLSANYRSAYLTIPDYASFPF
ncbi:Signal peptidase complex subunit [Dirofilaria immitis]